MEAYNMKNLVITVARGYGSGGKTIASRVAEDFGIHCYENRILTLASQVSGLDKELFAEANERLPDNSLLRGLLHGIPHSTRPAVRKFRSHDELFAIQRKIIETLADTESCVIVGKCADHILRDRPNVVSVYIEAPREFCRAEIMRRMQVSAEVADRSITDNDTYRAEYYKYYTNGNYWTNPVNYDLTINRARAGFENSVRIIEDYVRMKFPDMRFPCDQQPEVTASDVTEAEEVSQ